MQVTGNEAQGTMIRRKITGEAPSRPFFLPAFLYAQIFIKTKRSGYEAAQLQYPTNFSEKIDEN